MFTLTPFVFLFIISFYVDKDILAKGVSSSELETCRREYYRSQFGVSKWYGASLTHLSLLSLIISKQDTHTHTYIPIYPNKYSQSLY